MTRYNKLVRDKIPRLIEEQGERPVIQILDDAAYAACLEQKLDEEVSEFHRDRNVEELADILEVVFALAENLGSDRNHLMDVYHQKHASRGGFADRIFLIAKE